LVTIKGHPRVAFRFCADGRMDVAKNARSAAANNLDTTQAGRNRPAAAQDTARRQAPDIKRRIQTSAFLSTLGIGYHGTAPYSAASR
jgi:hypothetical protein